MKTAEYLDLNLIKRAVYPMAFCFKLGGSYTYNKITY